MEKNTWSKEKIWYIENVKDDPTHKICKKRKKK